MAAQIPTNCKPCPKEDTAAPKQNGRWTACYGAQSTRTAGTEGSENWRAAEEEDSKMQGLTFNPTYLTSPHQGKDSCTEILTRASDPQSLVFYKVSPDVLAPSQYTSGPLRGRTGTSWNAQEGHWSPPSCRPGPGPPRGGSGCGSPSLHSDCGMSPGI